MTVFGGSFRLVHQVETSMSGTSNRWPSAVIDYRALSLSRSYGLTEAVLKILDEARKPLETVNPLQKMGMRPPVINR